MPHTENDLDWWFENRCPINVADPDDRVYFKLTQPLENVYNFAAGVGPSR